LKKVTNAREPVLSGPTASITPQPFSKKGVTAVMGVRITHPTKDVAGSERGWRNTTDTLHVHREDRFLEEDILKEPSSRPKKRRTALVVDPYGRQVTGVRVSVTQKCNLHCFYCHREGEYTSNDDYAEMTPQEMERIIDVTASFDVRHVKLTGGEPLMRGDILEIVERISSLDGISEVSMTTNGTFLRDLAGPLKACGLARVNVSLDTLKPKTYQEITGVDAMQKVTSGIKGALEAGLNPIKVNMVLLKGVNDDEVWSMIEFAERNGVILQLIELESSKEDKFYMKYHSDISGIENQLKRRAENITVRRMHHRKKYYLPGDVEVEIVRPMHNTEFCRYCNRIRITSDGKFKPCLFRSDNLVEFLGPMRDGASTEDLKRLFLESIRRRRPYFM